MLVQCLAGVNWIVCTGKNLPEVLLLLGTEMRFWLLPAVVPPKPQAAFAAVDSWPVIEELVASRVEGFPELGNLLLAKAAWPVLDDEGSLQKMNKSGEHQCLQKTVVGTTASLENSAKELLPFSLQCFLY